MTIKATKFTPEVMLSAPRRDSVSPNSDGSLVLYTLSQYSFVTHKKAYAFKVLHVKSGIAYTLFEDTKFSEPTWISSSHFVFLDNSQNGSSLMVADATVENPKPHKIHSFEGLISNIKVKALGDGTVAFACTARAEGDGRMVGAGDKKENPLSSAKIYDSLFVRHWDHYVESTKDAVWYGALEKDGDSFALQGGKLLNALAKTGLECPVPPFGGVGDFDIGSHGLAFVSKDPSLNAAMWTKTDLYFVPLRSFTEDPVVPQQVITGGLNGFTGSPVFSHDGKRLAFTRMQSMQYESDKWRLMLLPDVHDLTNVQEFYKTADGKGGWDLRPESIAWSQDDTELYVTAEREGRIPLFKLPATPLDAKEVPQQLTSQGSVKGFFCLEDGRLFAISSSLIDSSFFTFVEPENGSVSLVSSLTKGGTSLGLSPHQFDEFWFDGAGDYKCHALVMKPSNFDPEKRYPLAMLIHGGPQGAWNDSWSTRWNPAVFAEQGFVVVAPNPTGSTGYGQDLIDSIAEQWGGRPYNDLVNCYEYISDQLTYVDMSNAVALGASYGGYMINWIQGHPLGRKFKALVCHDGIFSTMSNWSTEELWFPIHDMGGTIWERRDLYEKWDPSAHTDKWETPQLVIHSELDYRLPISEGLAAFNVLQARGVPSRLLTFPDENHWVLKPENSRVWHSQVLSWIKGYTSDSNKSDEDTVTPTGSGKS